MQEAIRETAQSRLNEITAQMSAAAKLASRVPADITLIAVSKTRSIGEIEPLIRAGHQSYGENRIQEAQTKWPELEEFECRDCSPPDRTIAVQQGRRKQSACLMSFIRSIAFRLPRPWGRPCVTKAGFCPVFIQVNIGAEPQKGGCAIEALSELLAATKAENIPVAGLMCLPPADIEPAPYFALLAELSAALRSRRFEHGHVR